MEAVSLKKGAPSTYMSLHASRFPNKNHYNKSCFIRSNSSRLISPLAYRCFRISSALLVGSVPPLLLPRTNTRNKATPPAITKAQKIIIINIPPPNHGPPNHEHILFHLAFSSFQPTGNRIVNVVPSPAALITSTVAPCSSIICLAMANPKPVPPLARDLSAL